MEQYLIDTNAVSDYLANAFPLKGMQFMDTVIDAAPNLSIITQIELLCWNTENDIELNVKSFIADSIILNIDDNVIANCVAIRKGKKIKTPDAIIAATALTHGLTLISHNTNDFKNIKGLKFIDPHAL